MRGNGLKKVYVGVSFRGGIGVNLGINCYCCECGYYGGACVRVSLNIGVVMGVGDNFSIGVAMGVGVGVRLHVELGVDKGDGVRMGVGVDMDVSVGRS